MDSVFCQENHTRRSSTPIMPDVLIDVAGYTFYMHKALLLNSSMYLRKLIQEHSYKENELCAFTLDIPGGAPTFKIIAKFLYGQNLELTSSNIIPVICAAYYLDMTEDYTTKGLISQAETFLSKEIFPKWKETIEALVSCEDILSHADEVDLVSACLVRIAYKVSNQKSTCPDWWFEDVCSLNLYLFKRFVQLLRAVGHDPANISNALIYYANEYDLGSDPNSTGIWFVEERKLLQEIVSMLPVQKRATSTKYLHSMLSAGIMLNCNLKCIENLERRIGTQLDEDSLMDLLAPDSGDKCEAKLDFGCIRRIIEHFVEENLLAIEALYKSHGKKCSREADFILSEIAAVANVIDGYLFHVASCENLKMEEFLSLASAIPEAARPSHNGLCRAISAYIQYHPWISEEQQERLCQLLDVQKLSGEACLDAVINSENLLDEFISGFPF